MSRLSVQTLPARRRNPALSPAWAAVSNLDSAVGSGQSGRRCVLARRGPRATAESRRRQTCTRGPRPRLACRHTLAARRSSGRRSADLGRPPPRRGALPLPANARARPRPVVKSLGQPSQTSLGRSADPAASSNPPGRGDRDRAPRLAPPGCAADVRSREAAPPRLAPPGRAGEAHRTGSRWRGSPRR